MRVPDRGVMDLREQGKESRAHHSSDPDVPRPGNREVDPKRDDDRFE